MFINTKTKTILLAILLLFFFIIILIYLKNKIELFKNIKTDMNVGINSNNENVINNINLFNDSKYEKNRTLLYGSLFLDNLDKQINNMTDPDIQYNTKRIDIIKYSDILI